MAETRVEDLALERNEIRKRRESAESKRNLLAYFGQLSKYACTLPGGYVKKIVWDEAGGYPEHAWGYTQYTVRPYVQGYGCDGTTDENIHLIASTLCAAAGVDYASAYNEAYPGDDPLESTQAWVAELPKREALVKETILPSLSNESLMLALSDLYQINNRTLVCILEERLSAAGHDVSKWCLREDELRRQAKHALAA